MSERLKQIGRDLLAKKAKINAPEFNLMDYDSSLAANLNFYRIEVESSKLRDFANAYWESIGKDISLINNVNDHYFSTAGALAHMHHFRNVGLLEKHVKSLDEAYETCLSNVKAPVEKKEKKKEVDPTPVFIAELEGAIDDIMVYGKEFDAKHYLSKNGIKPDSLKKIAVWFKPKLEEYKLAASGEDEQLTEGYSNFGKRGLNKLIHFVTLIIETSNNISQIKRVQKPRTKKQKPAAVLVRDIKITREVPELNLKSVETTKIIDSSEVWVYDTQKRKLIKVIAPIGEKLSAKGKTILNFDPDLTVAKTIRKPEEQLKGIQSLPKKQLLAKFNEIKSTEQKFSGRIQESFVIINIFN